MLAAASAATAMTAKKNVPVVVRTITSKGAASLQIQFMPATGATGPRTLLRPCSEALDRSLSRLSAAATSKKPKKGAAAKVGPSESAAATALLDEYGAIIPLTTPVREAWAIAAWLSIDTERRAVLFDPPEVAEVRIPAAPLIGIPLLALVSTRSCEPAACRFEWTRHAPGDDVEGGASLPVEAAQAALAAEAPAAGAGGTVVGRSQSYIPTAEDIGAVLRVRAVPPAPSFASGSASAPEARAMGEAAAALLGGLAEAPGIVERPPMRWLLDSRIATLNAARLNAVQEAGAAAREGGAVACERGPWAGFRLLTYNLMAETYQRHWDEPGSVHSYCSPALTRAAHRMPRLLDEVFRMQADVICLQEVDRSWFEALWKPHMKAAGYTCVGAPGGAPRSLQTSPTHAVPCCPAADHAEAHSVPCCPRAA